jgi:pullulanase-type alpha-1,6-glucosidase
VPAGERGTYLAFTRDDTAGMRHLTRLADAGLNTVHLLPAFDIATIEERRSAQQSPGCDLAALPPDSTEQQECIDAVRAGDGFNWGYDPLHYTAPEGSYATDPDGTRRTVEFRRMVQGLNEAGLQVVMDVVYNHTAAHGQAAKSVLDKVVPGYYQRLNATGGVESSTCCSNTATEHRMMEKLMVDSVLTWARDYKVNGFRFDLMGHHSLENMTHLREALDGLTVEDDGVDGRAIYLYGEGWNFGEVADDARFEQATQLNLAGSGIGSFSDRLRDAVRGGGPFDDDPRIQGFGSGLFTDPNGAEVNGTADAQRSRLLHLQDLVKLGLAGNLADYSFRSSAGETVVGSEVDYNGQPAGYAADPAETVTYVDAHDNETLFDSLAFKLPQGTSMADRVRMNTVSLSTVALSQGVVFWHAGTDLLRSKSLDRNSYDSSDWFNRVDWQRRDNTFGSGLPLRADNEAKWPYMRPLLADPALDPGTQAMDAAHAAAQDLLEIRMSSPLFRLGTADAIQAKVSFLDAAPGVIAMHVDDTAGTDADADRGGFLVVFNATPEPQSVEGTGAGWTLHSVQASGADEVVKGSTATGDSVTVPARTTAVFER